MSVIDLLSEWVNVDAAMKKVVKVLTEVQQKGSDFGVQQGTKNSNVKVERVHLSDVPKAEVVDGEIKKSHGELIGAWGQTRVTAVLQFAVPQGKDGNFYPGLRCVKVNAKITLKPESGFKKLADFAPHYRKLMTEFGGRKEEFCAAMSNMVFPDYNDFGTVDGVLYHELTHFALAKKFAQKLFRPTVAGTSGQGYSTAQEATDAFIEVVDNVWGAWRGLIKHDPGFFDERFVWEKECAFYIKAYEAAGKPGYGE